MGAAIMQIQSRPVVLGTPVQVKRSVLCAAVGTPHRPHGAVERVLRYPDGQERRISYPIADEQEPVLDEVSEWDTGRWWQSANVSLKSPVQKPATTTQPQPTQPAQQTFTFFNWEDLRRQAEVLRQQVQGSYQVLHGCPWAVPRPMFVLTVAHNLFDSHHRFYSMQVRVRKSLELTDELARVIGSQRIASSISMSDMKEGVLAFSSRALAERYVAGMTAEDDAVANGSLEVHVGEVGSHELFRLVVGEAKGCVVALGFNPTGSNSAPIDDTFVPSPMQLSGSLRGQQEWCSSSSSSML